jgi:SET domain-containing protein
MLYVKTRIGPSKIHGIGLFAAQKIPKGTDIWKFTPGFDLRLAERNTKKLSQQAREYLEFYAYRSKKSQMWVLPMDNGKYFNHSDTPNTLSSYHDDQEEVITKAIKDIESGEEMTDDYHSFENWAGHY